MMVVTVRVAGRVRSSNSVGASQDNTKQTHRSSGRSDKPVIPTLYLWQRSVRFLLSSL